MKGHRDLIWTSGAAIVCAALALLIPVEAISFVFLAPLAFFLTGYAISAAALPRWHPEPALRATTSLGISLAVLALGGLLLNYLGGLRPLPWALLMVVIVVGCCRQAALVRPRATTSQPAIRIPRPAVLSVVATLLGLLAAGGGLALAFQPVSANRAVGFSELWINTGASPSTFRVGVGNQEHQTVTYGVIARIVGAKTVERHVELKPGQRKVLVLPVTDRTRPGPLQVGVTLYREGFPNQPYRRVSGWVPNRTAAR
jgi:uncharacterized membrane protein